MNDRIRYLLHKKFPFNLKAFKDIVVLFKTQQLISFFSFSVFSWRLAEAFKRSVYDYLGVKLYTWFDIFFHPYESNLINYIFLCIATGSYSILTYYIFLNEKTIKLVKKESGWISKKSFIVILFGSGIILVLAVKTFTTYRTLSLFLIALLPVFYIFNNYPKVWIKIKAISDTIRRIANIENRGQSFREMKFVLLGILLLMIFLEPLYMVSGTKPIYLVNEYDIYSSTILDSGIINNEIFLNSLEGSDFEADKLGSKIQAPISEYMMPPTQKVMFHTIFQNLEMLISDLAVEYIDSNNTPQELQYADQREIQAFIGRNFLENLFYKMSRGQLNHIGHILNPVNEYTLGKSINEIYFQYGIGNTFLMKWTMELFGGISLHNYYKCYIYYLIYFMIFLVFLFVLFKESGYVLCCFAVLVFAFFYQGYIGFIIAPGIIPTIHMLDAPVFILLILYFRQNKIFYFLSAIVLSLLSIMLNQQFGFFLVASLIVSIFLFVNEKKEGREKRIWLSGTLLIMIISMIVYYLSGTNPPNNAFIYFLTGLFSWPAHRIIILLTICYFAISYLFMFMLKSSRHYLKYIYLMIFVYTQGLFVYYYWAGLVNHLPTIMPFVGVQVFLMVHMMQKNIIANTIFNQKMGSLIKILSISVLLVLILQNGAFFYRQRTLFLYNFTTHKTYKWNYDKARLISTINPEPINKGINIIRKYSADGYGIYIISRYDNLLPFLAERYSLMPFFEMSWHLFSDWESKQAIEMLRNRKPRYLFVDTHMGGENYMWDILYPYFYNESASRRGRNMEMNKVFMAVSEDYEKIEEGPLLSVYRRKP